MHRTILSLGIGKPTITMPGIFSQGLSSSQGLSNSKFARHQSSLESYSVASTSSGTYRSRGSNSSSSASSSSKPPRFPKGTNTNLFYSNKENTGAMDFRTMSATIAEEEERQQSSTTRNKPSRLQRSRLRMARQPPSDPLEEEWGYFVDCAEW